MSNGLPSLQGIQAHLEQLRLQEQDAKLLLSQPEPRPGVHRQLPALLRRLSAERAGLQASLTEHDPVHSAR
ncbi:MAG: hypothetical protein ACXVZV_07620 [Terriglobales bacterium]